MDNNRQQTVPGQVSMDMRSISMVHDELVTLKDFMTCFDQSYINKKSQLTDLISSNSYELCCYYLFSVRDCFFNLHTHTHTHTDTRVTAHVGVSLQQEY